MLSGFFGNGIGLPVGGAHGRFEGGERGASSSDIQEAPYDQTGSELPGGRAGLPSQRPVFLCQALP